MDDMKVPESSAEHKEAKKALTIADAALREAEKRYRECSQKERKLRPFCPRCKCRAGEGTVEEMCCGGDFETVVCPTCRPEEYRRDHLGR